VHTLVLVAISKDVSALTMKAPILDIAFVSVAIGKFVYREIVYKGEERTWWNDKPVTSISKSHTIDGI
jgi:hypothetical protein